jgi:hypothetical protein
MVCMVASVPREELYAFVTGSRRTLPASTLEGPQWLAETL